MALTERSRSAVYRGLSGIIDDEEAVGEMLSYFPARDVDEPAREDFVRAEIAGVRSEIADVRSEIADVRAEIAATERRLIEYVHAEIRTSMQWTIGAMVALNGLLVAAVSALT